MVLRVSLVDVGLGHTATTSVHDVLILTNALPVDNQAKNNIDERECVRPENALLPSPKEVKQNIPDRLSIDNTTAYSDSQP
jgi:hypothetical protein